MYQVVEHFYSIQGEGSWSGRPATFIRLYGCDMACHFCDEPLHKDMSNIIKMDKEAILALCHNSPLVIITGGEPSLNDLGELIRYLKGSGKNVAVETNGYSYYNASAADLVTLAPKKGRLRPDGVWDDIKLLVSVDNYITVEDEIKYWKAMGGRVFLSAINEMGELNKDNNKLAFDLSLKYNVTLNVQLHKVIGVR